MSERLENIQQESITDAIEWGCRYGSRSQVKTDKIVDDVNWLIKKAEENVELREALVFYANPKSWEEYEDMYAGYTTEAKEDSGSIARKALEESK